MRVLQTLEIHAVSGGAHSGSKPTDAAPTLAGKRIGWCWGLGNTGDSQGKGKGLVLPKHTGADCGCAGGGDPVLL